MISKLRAFANLDRYRNSLAKNNLALRQRADLFRNFTFLSLIVLLISIYQYPFENWKYPFCYYLFFGLFMVLYINYFLLNFYFKPRIFYWVTVVIMLLLLHVSTYFTGGLKNSGTSYILCIILYSYMLLGKSGGMAATLYGILHVIYFFLVEEYTTWADYSLIKNDAHLINIDYLATFIVSILIIRNQSNYLERTKNEIITDIIQSKNQLIQSELKALRAQMNPHFVFNVLNSIQYYITHNKVEKADAYLTKFSRLMRKVLDNSSSSFITLENELTALTIYLDLEKLRFEDKFDYTVSAPALAIQKQTYLPAMIIQPFAENAILHAFTEMKTGGKLDILFEVDNKKTICTITDNGKGYHFNKDGSWSGDANNHKSKGQELVQDRINAINELYNCNITLQIINLENVGSKGTQIKIIIPLINFKYDTSNQ